MTRNRRRALNGVLLAVAFLVTVVCAATGAYIQEGYQIEVNKVSDQRIKAPATVENKLATERNRQAASDAAERLEPITARDSAAMDELRLQLEGLFLAADELRYKQVQIFTPYNAADTTPDEVETEQGELTPEPTPTPAPAPKLAGLTESATKTLLDMDSERYAAFTEGVYAVAERVLANGVQEIDARALLAVKDEMDKLDLNSEARSLGYDIISLYLKPNIIIDEEATAEAREERAAKYERVYYQKGQTIVDDGEIVSEDVYAVLTDLGMINTGYADKVLPILGALLLVGIIFATAALYLYFFEAKVLSNLRETLLVFSLYILVVLSARALLTMPFQLLPITIFTILTATFLGSRTATILNLGITVVCFIILRGDVEFLVYYSLSGAAAAFIAGFTTERGRIFLAALTTSIINFCLYTGVALLLQKNYSAELFFNSAYAAMAGMLSVIISFGSMPLWEAVFGLVTPIRLLDLTNPDSKLLRRLAIEAPGTYHHSVIVANLAETAAYDIGANISVARTGGYYHDIGKLKYPQYFAENMVGDNPHEGMEPEMSVKVILSHVTYGVELAIAGRLPKVVQDIILQHHGTTLLKYFYHKAKAMNPALDADAYRYPFEIPQSKEAAVVMLADTVEAAVRSMIPTGKSMDEVLAFTTELVRDKLDDGQLRDSTLTIRDLDTVVKSFMRVFRGMYHERIPYPRDDKPEAKAEKLETEAE